MKTQRTGAAWRTVAAVLLALGLGGCVYAPPYAYDTYPAYGYPAYNYPTYVGPPVTLDFGFSYYDRPRHHRHGHHHGWRHHGGRDHHGGGWWHGGGWRHGRGRH